MITCLYFKKKLKKEKGKQKRAPGEQTLSTAIRLKSTISRGRCRNTERYYRLPAQDFVLKPYCSTARNYFLKYFSY